MASKKTDRTDAGHAISKGIADVLLPVSTTGEADAMLMGYNGTREGKLCEFVMSVFLGEESLKSEKDHTLWNPLYKLAVDNLDRPDRDGVIVCQSYT